MQNWERYHFSFIPCHFIGAPSRPQAISVPDLALADRALATREKIQNGRHNIKYLARRF